MAKQLFTSWIVVLAFLLLPKTAFAQEPGDSTYNLGPDKFLFLDSFLLDKVENAELRVNQPQCTGLVLIADKPWEKGGITSYGNVLWDPEIEEFRLYYVPVSWDVPPGFCLALATSRDGRNWTKPNLGAVEWNGSKENNIVVWGQREGTVTIDPNAPPKRRYAFLSSEPNLKTRLFTSPDGIHFTMDEEVISGLHSDSQISSFWDRYTQRYFHYPRRILHDFRAVGFVTTSSMAETWPDPDTIPVVMGRDDRDPPEMDLYTNAAEGYSRDAYLAFPTPYYHYNRPPTRAYLNEPTLAKGGKGNDGTIESQLATSRDGKNWTRYRSPYVPLGRYQGLDVKIAMMIPGIHEQDGLLYQYFMGYTFTHGDTQVRYGDGGRELGGVFLVEQRLDGFLSLDFDYEGGTVVTAPFVFGGSRLSLNLNTSASGDARVAILNAEGEELPGFGLGEARFINGDYLDKTVEWKDGASDVSRFSGVPIRLRFECRGTKLYSFQFKE